MSIVADILEVAFDVGKFVAQAISSGDEKQWRPIAEILPSPLKSRVEMVAQRAQTQKELEEVLGKD